MPDHSPSRRQRWRSIIEIAWPLIIANSFWNLQLTIDRIFLGNYSTEALGASMAVNGVFWTPMALLQQTAAYLMTFVAQYFGAKQYSMIGYAVWQGIYLSVIGGLLFLLLVPAAGPLFVWIGHSPNMQILEAQYFGALCFSALPAALVAAASGFFTGFGSTKTVMWINCVGLIANALLDPIMIFGGLGFPALGVAGAGYATAIANWMSAIFGLALLFHQKYESKYKVRSHWRIHWDLLKRYVRYGIPSGMQWALEGLAFTVFLVFVGRMKNGDAGLSASGIVVTVMMLAILPALGVAQAVTVLVGRHLGEKKPGEAEISTWSGLQVAVMYIACIGSTFVLFPRFYLSWFYNAENAALWSEVSIMVPYLLLYVALFTCFDSMSLIFSFALKGAGDTRFVTLVALTVPWVLMVIPTYFLKELPGAIYWAWGAASLYSISQALIFWRRFVGGKWKAMSVIGSY